MTPPSDHWRSSSCAPPPLRPRRGPNLRSALLLNLCFPGTGLIYAGQRLSGFLISGAFSACLVAGLTIFLLAYARYMSIAVSGEVLTGTRLEEIQTLFDVPLLLTLLAAGLILLILSIALLDRASARKIESVPSLSP